MVGLLQPPPEPTSAVCVDDDFDFEDRRFDPVPDGILILIQSSDVVVLHFRLDPDRAAVHGIDLVSGVNIIDISQLFTDKFLYDQSDRERIDKTIPALVVPGLVNNKCSVSVGLGEAGVSITDL